MARTPNDTFTRLWLIAQQQGYTQTAWARAAGIDPSSVSELRRTGRSPAVATLEMLAKAIGVRIELVPEQQAAA